jgi:hypothetical protein
MTKKKISVEERRVLEFTIKCLGSEIAKVIDFLRDEYNCNEFFTNLPEEAKKEKKYIDELYKKRESLLCEYNNSRAVSSL